MISTDSNTEHRLPGQVARAQRGTLLAVDDRTRNVELLQSTLGAEGYEVIPATSGAQALDCVALKVPDLILLDVMMPEMDGFEVCRRLKRDPRTADVAVIFLSAAGDKESIIRGIELGGVDYVTKPFTKEELLARVNTHVTLKHLLDRNRSLLQARHRLVAEEIEDMKRPLRAITHNLGELSRSLQPAAANGVNQLLTETLMIANDALGHLSRELLGWGSDANHETSTEFPVGSKQLEELIGKWYLSARRRRIEFKMGRLGKDVSIACHLSPLTYLIDLLMASAVNMSNSGDAIEVSLQVVEAEVVVSIAHSTPFQEEGRKPEGEPGWLEPSALDLQLTQETERLGGSLRLGAHPNGRKLMVLALPLQE
jgi:two-component system sensor histidine kinase/response regulator